MASIWRTCVGCVLTLVMLVTLLACAITFSARSFQHNFAQVSGNQTGVFSRAAIARMAQELARLEQDTAPERIKLEELLRQQQQLSRRLLDAQAEGLERAEEARALLAPIEVRLEVEVGAGVDLGVLAERLAALRSREDLLEGEQTALERAEALLTQANQRAALTAEIEAERQALAAQIEEVNGILGRAADRILQERRNLGENYEAVLAEVEALRNTSPVGLGIMLAEMHPAFLSTLLVCLSGALGAIFYLFPAFMTRAEKVGLDDIAVRWLLGVTAAFVFMVAANAANSLLSLGAAAPSDVPQPSLNPFTIAGLGVIAGVMAPDIARWIHSRGAALIYQGRAGQVIQQIETHTSVKQSAPAAAAPNPVTIKATRDVAASLGGMANPHGGPNEPI